MPDHRARRGAPHLGRPRQGVPRRARRAVRRAGRARARRSSPRPPPSRPRSSRSSRSGPTPTPPPSTWPSGSPPYAPGDLNRVFFTTGGGEAVETAWKLAKQYFKLIGKPTKHKVISRAIAYHGTPQGALSITGIPAAKEAFEPLVPGALKVPNTNQYRAPEHVRDDGKAFGRWAADRIEEAILFEGPDTVAAVFLEPVQNSGGCFPPPPGYFERVREICDEYDVLLVSDEVICAFGRIGSMFACDDFGYVPDMITCAKGMTSGYSPIGAMIAVRPAVRAVHARAPRRSRTATRSAGTRCPRRSRWPTSTSSSARASTITSRRTPPRSGPRSRSCSTCRSSATSAAPATSTASSWSRTRTTRETFDDDESERLLRGFLSKALFEAGLYCRADDRGDPVVQLAPPLIVGQAEFDEMEQILRVGPHRRREAPLSRRRHLVGIRLGWESPRPRRRQRARLAPLPRCPHAQATQRLPAHADVVIVGGGFTGLWTAYYLLRADPALDVVLLEAEHVGFGASGRNGGWCRRCGRSGRGRWPDGTGRRRARDAGRLQRHGRRGRPGCGSRGDRLRIPQGWHARRSRARPRRPARARAEVDAAPAVGRRARAGSTPTRPREHAGRERGSAARRSPRTAPGSTRAGWSTALPRRSGAGRPDPRGRRGCRRSSRAGSCSTTAGRSLRRHVIRAPRPGPPRCPATAATVAPVYSLMVATEPLPPTDVGRIGLRDGEVFSDHRHVIIYGQRTADGRLAFGGRGAPYHFGSRDPAAHSTTTATVFADLRASPAPTCCRSWATPEFTHAWGGPLGIARDWHPCVGHDPAHGSGLGRRLRRRRRRGDQPRRPHPGRPGTGRRPRSPSCPGSATAAAGGSPSPCAGSGSTPACGSRRRRPRGGPDRPPRTHRQAAVRPHRSLAPPGREDSARVDRPRRPVPRRARLRDGPAPGHPHHPAARRVTPRRAGRVHLGRRGARGPGDHQWPESQGAQRRRRRARGGVPGGRPLLALLRGHRQRAHRP